MTVILAVSRAPKGSFRSAFLLLVVAVFLPTGCKTSRKALSSVPADRMATSPGTASTASTPAAYPAREYYGDRWNSEHVRINSDPGPSGAVSLNLIPAGTSGFIMPCCGKVLSEFGPRNGRMHTGIDIKLEREDPVYCVFDGMVRLAKNYGNYGNVVVVRHDNGLETLYGHLNSIAVKLNRRVKAGDRIGGGGKTGNAQGEHLHFETRFKGEPFNPRIVIDFDGCRLKSQTLALDDNSYQLYYKNLQASENGRAGTAKPAAQSATERDKPEQTVKHTVEKGDTLYNISRRYGTTVDSLRRLNRLTDSSVIEIGQILIVR